MANAPIPREESIAAPTSQISNQQKQPTKMSSDGEDFEYEDDTGFDEDVDMDGESRGGDQVLLQANTLQLPTRQSKGMRLTKTRDTMHSM